MVFPPDVFHDVLQVVTTLEMQIYSINIMVARPSRLDLLTRKVITLPIILYQLKMVKAALVVRSLTDDRA